MDEEPIIELPVEDVPALDQNDSKFLQSFNKDGSQFLDAEELSSLYEDFILENGEIPTSDEQKKMVLILLLYLFYSFFYQIIFL